MNAETIKIESDERGFELHIETDEGERFVFNFQGVADAFLTEMKMQVGPWVAEMNAARHEYERVRWCPPSERVVEEGMNAMDWFLMTGDDEPLREMADEQRARAKEGAE